MKKRLLLFVLTICLLVVPSIGCAGNQKVLSPLEIHDKTLKSLEGLDTCVFNFDFMRTQAFAEPDGPYLSSDRWESTRAMDLANRRLAMTMDISNPYPNLPGYLVRYVDNGSVYESGSAYGASSGVWTQGSGITDDDWAVLTQIPDFIELLKSTSNIMWSPDEEAAGADCFVEALRPSAVAAVDWLLSQSDNPGQSILLGGWAGDILSSRDAYLSGYQGGQLRAWISKGSFQLVKLEIDLEFNVISFNGGLELPGVTEPPATQYMRLNFFGKIVFDSYNQPVAIHLPQEALQAPRQFRALT